jgi:hypothetical protein
MIYLSLLKNFRISFMAVAVLLWNAILGAGIYLDGLMANPHGFNSSFSIATSVACMGFTTFFISLFFSQRTRNIALRPGATIAVVRNDLQIVIFIIGSLSLLLIIGWLYHWLSA